MHQGQNEKLTLTLQARIRNGNEEKIINLKTLSQGEILNPNSFEGHNSFEIDYDEINAYLAQHTPHLKLSPGTPLAVHALWEGRGHQWGGYGRGGVFHIPQRTQNPIGQSAAVQSGSGKIQGDLPLDIGVVMAKDLTTRFRGLVEGGQFTSRMEAEVKARIGVDEIPEIYQKLEHLVNSRWASRRTLGRDWTISRKDRYYQKDDQGKVMQDANGLPMVHPVKDRYYDSNGRDLAKNHVAIRFREMVGDEVGKLNIKPGEGTMVEDNIFRRIEYGMDVDPSIKTNPGLLSSFFNSVEHLNPFRHISDKLGINSQHVLRPSMDLEAKRYKFVLEHKNGTEIEISVDDVVCTVLDQRGNPMKNPDGSLKQGRFGQIEFDLEHLQTQSSQVVNNSGAAFASLGQFRNEQQQTAWLGNLDANATLSGPPRIHEPEDVDNKSLIETEGYESLEKLAPGLQKYLLPNGGPPALQKYHRGAQVCALIPMDDADKVAYEAALQRAGGIG